MDMKPKNFISEIIKNDFHLGKIVTICGWVRTRRDSKIGISFINVCDGSSSIGIQVVAEQTLSNYGEILRLTSGCSVIVTGKFVKSLGSG